MYQNQIKLGKLKLETKLKLFFTAESKEYPEEDEAEKEKCIYQDYKNHIFF